MIAMRVKQKMARTADKMTRVLKYIRRTVDDNR